MTLLLAFFFLIFFQLVADFVEATYAFGLLETRVPPETAMALVLLAPALLTLGRPPNVQRLALPLAIVVFAARVAYPLLDTRGRMLTAGLGVGGALLLLPILVKQRHRSHGRDSASALASGLTLAVAASILLRTLGSGTDISTVGWTQLLVWSLVPFTVHAVRGRGEESRFAPAAGGTRGVAYAAVGMLAALTLLYFAFTAPNVIARWTEQSNVLIIALLVLAPATFALGTRHVGSLLTPSAVAALNAAFVAALTSTLLLQQVDFPSDPSAYPIFEQAPDEALVWLALAPMLLLSPVLVFDFWLCATRLIEARPTSADLGFGFTLGALVMAAAIFAQIFTSTYDYVPLVEPLFRDRFWLVFLALGLAVAVSTVAVTREVRGLRLGTSYATAPMLGLGLLSVAAAALAGPAPASVTPGSSLKVLTYNIQQGYGEDGQRSLDRQIDLIRRLDADIVGLQETDTNRVAGGNTDAVRIMATALDMHSYYGPKPVVGTFGVALLSRYPIESARTLYMYSEGEQTAAILATFDIDGQTLDVIVTHLGNDGPMVQQQAILRVAAELESVILIGDFNFRPRDPQHELTRQLLNDAWLLRWPAGVDDTGDDHEGRIDHVFVSPGTTVLDARYVESSASDHPALIVQISR